MGSKSASGADSIVGDREADQVRDAPIDPRRFVAKPFDRDTLLTAIADALADLQPESADRPH